MNRLYTIVTGASMGLGKSIAVELASMGKNLILVSLPNEGLIDFAHDLQKAFGIDAVAYEVNLIEPDAVYAFSSWVNRHYEVDVLVNNAGIGGSGLFAESSPERIDAIIQLNMRVPAMLIRLLLSNLQRQTHAYVLNVASMASFSPFAYKTVYPASKAFLWSFSRGLYEELKHSKIFISVIHPGPMPTNADCVMRIKRQGLLGKIGNLSPEEIAKIAIRQLFKHDSLIIPGFLNKLNWLLMRLIPIWIRLPIVSRIVRREFTPKTSMECTGYW